MGVTTWRRLNRRRDHRWARPRFSNFIDGSLPAGEQRRLAHHEDICPECAHLIATLQALLMILPSLRLPPAASFEVAERTAERVRARLGEWN
jgi:anti-sigma factor RsiW